LTRRLAPGRWRGEVADALERLLEYQGRGRPEYSEQDPPVALLVFDDVSINNSPGESLFFRLVTRASFKFTDGFWEKIPEQYGKASLRSAYEAFRERLAGLDAEQETVARDMLRAREELFEPEALDQALDALRQARERIEVRRTAALVPLLRGDPGYRRYRKGMLRCYQSICADMGEKVCASWLTSLLDGLTEEEVAIHSRAMLDSEFRREIGMESIEASLDDPAPVRFPVGLRAIPEMRDLYSNLKRRGFDVWVLSTTNDWTIKMLTSIYGVDPSRTVGVRSAVSEGRLTGRVLIPIPYGTGQAAAVTFFIGRPPALVVGAGRDEAVLDYGNGLRVVMAGPGDNSEPWTRRGWSVQPRFSPDRAPQEFGPAQEEALSVEPAETEPETGTSDENEGLSEEPEGEEL